MLLPPAARAESALRLREEGFTGAQDPGRSAPARGGPRGGRRDARTRSATRWRSWSTSTRAGGWPATRRARSTRSPPARSPPGSPSYDVLWLEEPLAGTDLRGPGGAAGVGARDPHRRRRDDPDVRRAAGRARGRRVRRLPARRRPGRRDARGRGRSPSSPSRATAGSRRTPGRTGSGCWPTCTSRPASAAARSSSSRTTRPAGPPSGATSCSPSRSGPGPDGILRVPPTPGLGIVLDEAAIRAVRGMSDRHRRHQPTAADWLARAAAIAPRTELFIDGRFVPAASGRTFDDIAGRDGSRIAAGRRGRRRGRRPGGRGRPAGVRRRSLGGPAAGRPQAGPAPARRAHPRAPRGARAARIARRRQADPRHARGRRPERRHDVPVVRRDDRQGLRRGRPDRARRAVARHPRADRRGRRDRALELPADHHRLEARRGARDRQLGRPQAGQPVAADARCASPSWPPRPACPTASSTS